MKTKSFIIALAIIAISTAAFSATNTMSYVETFTGISVSNATSGIAVNYSQAVAPTNILIVVTSGEIFITPTVQEQSVSAGSSSSSSTLWTYCASGNALRIPVINAGKFYVKTTNTANNAMTVVLE